MFEQISFQNLNETDVREEILAPLIRKLGYRSGSDHNVIREQSLRYPRAFIGRKNLKKDPILRGKADYILEAGSVVRWVVEAKAPDVEIDIDSIEQAYTYANHPEVRAVYFLISNGRKFTVYQTNRGPDSEPILEISYDELNTYYQKLENLLSPNSILRDHPEVELDMGEPLGQGLRSVVRITNGIISYHQNTANIPALKEMQTSISHGAVERDEHDHLIAYLVTIAPTRSMQELNVRLGLTSFEMYSQDKYISNDPTTPTVFRSDETITLPAGERLLDINTWREVQLPCNMTCRVLTEASGHLENNQFFGSFSSNMHFLPMNMNVGLFGKFKIFVA